MKIQDSTPGHRSITLDKDEVLDSETLALALAVHGSRNLDEAYELVGEVYDSIEELLLSRKHNLAA